MTKKKQTKNSKMIKPMAIHPRSLYTLEEAGKFLRVNSRNVKNVLDKKEIKYDSTIGKGYRILGEDLLRITGGNPTIADMKPQKKS